MTKSKNTKEEILKEIENDINDIEAYDYSGSTKIIIKKISQAVDQAEQRIRKDLIEIIKEDADEDGFCNADYLIEEIKNYDK